MKRINVIFAVLTIALLSTIAFTSNADNEKEQLPVLKIKVKIYNNQYVQDCGDRVWICVHPNNWPAQNIYQDYTGASEYYFTLPKSYIGDLSAGVTTAGNCTYNIEIASPVATGTWTTGNIYTAPVYVYNQEL